MKDQPCLEMEPIEKKPVSSFNNANGGEYTTCVLHASLGEEKETETKQIPPLVDVACHRAGDSCCSVSGDGNNERALLKGRYDDCSDNSNEDEDANDRDRSLGMEQHNRQKRRQSAIQMDDDDAALTTTAEAAEAAAAETTLSFLRDGGGKENCVREAEPLMDTANLGFDSQGEGRRNRDTSLEKIEMMTLEKTEGNSAYSTASSTSDCCADDTMAEVDDNDQVGSKKTDQIDNSQMKCWNPPETSPGDDAGPEQNHKVSQLLVEVAPNSDFPQAEQIDDGENSGKVTLHLQGDAGISNTDKKGLATIERKEGSDTQSQVMKENRHAKSRKENGAGGMDGGASKTPRESETNSSMAAGDVDISCSKGEHMEELHETMICTSNAIECDGLIQGTPREQACHSVGGGNNVELAQEGEITIDVSQDDCVAPSSEASREHGFKTTRSDVNSNDACKKRVEKAETSCREEVGRASNTVRTICEIFERSNFSATDVDLEKFYMNQRARSVTYQRKKKEALGLYHGGEEILGNTLGEVDCSSWHSSELGVVQALGLAIEASSSKQGDDTILLMLNSSNTSSEEGDQAKFEGFEGAQGISEVGKSISGKITEVSYCTEKIAKVDEGKPCDASSRGVDEAEDLLHIVDEAYVLALAQIEPNTRTALQANTSSLELRDERVFSTGASAEKSFVGQAIDQSHNDTSFHLNSSIKGVDRFKKEALRNVDAVLPANLDLNFCVNRGEADQDKDPFPDFVRDVENAESKGDKTGEDQNSLMPSAWPQDAKGIGGSQGTTPTPSVGEAENNGLQAFVGVAGLAYNPKPGCQDQVEAGLNLSGESLFAMKLASKRSPENLECNYAEESRTNRNDSSPEKGQDTPTVDLLSHIRDCWGSNVDRLKEISTLLNFLSSRDVPLLDGAKVIQLKRELEHVLQQTQCDRHLENDAEDELLGKLFEMKAVLRGNENLFESMKKLQTLHLAANEAAAASQITAPEEPLIEEVMSDMDALIGDLESHIHLLAVENKQVEDEDEARKAKPNLRRNPEKQMHKDKQVEGRRTIPGGYIYPANRWEMLKDISACRLRNKIVVADQEEVEVVAVILKIHDMQDPSAFDSSLCVLNNEKPSSMRWNRGNEHTKKLKVKFLLRSESTSFHTYTSSDSTLVALGGGDALCCCLACLA